MESLSNVMQRISDIQNGFNKYFKQESISSISRSASEEIGAESTDFELPLKFDEELAKIGSPRFDTSQPAAAVPELESIDKARPAAFFTEEIRETAKKYALPEALLQSVVKTESAFNPFAVSSKGALGLMQLMPSTAEEKGVENPFDPKQNLEGGAKLLRQLIDSYDGDYVKALAAYNAGANSLKNNTLPAYKETHAYIRNAINSYLQYSGVR